MFFSAACMEARRLAFSLTMDSAKARYRATNRNCRISAENSARQSIVKVGKERESQLLVARFLSQARSMGRSCNRSEEHTSELQSLMRISYAVFCLKKQTNHKS